HQAAGPFASAAWSRRARCDGTTSLRTSSSPTWRRTSASRTPASCRTSSRKGRAPWCRGASAPTASSPPKKYWPSMTRTTCRRRRSTRSTRRVPARGARRDRRTGALRPDPRAVRGGPVGNLAPGGRPPRTARMDAARSPGCPGLLPAGGLRDGRAGLELLRERLLRHLRGGPLQLAAAHGVPAGGGVGRARRLAAALDIDAGRLDGRGCALL